MKYDEPGIYELTYKATDECGNESYATKQVTVKSITPPLSSDSVTTMEGEG